MKLEWSDYTNKEECFAIIASGPMDLVAEVRVISQQTHVRYDATLRCETSIVAQGLRQATKAEAQKEAAAITESWLVRISRIARRHGIGVEV